MNDRKTENPRLSAIEIQQRDLEIDYQLGRCPFCRGTKELIDPVIGDRVGCICTGVDPNTVLGTA